MGRSERIRYQERAGTHWADRVMAVSQATKDEITWMYEVPHWKTSVVYNGVIHIGFLSSTKILSPSRNFSRLYIGRYFGLRLSAVVQRDITLETSRFHRPVSLLRSSLEQRIESAGPGPAALSCSHPSGSGPRPQRDRAPSRLRRDQNNVSTASCSLVRPSRRIDVTALVTCPRPEAFNPV
jgi:hypothetical protein